MLPLLLTLLTVDPRFPKGMAPMQLPATVKGLRDWSARGCAKCHATSHADWQHSGHATARTNFVFQAALRYDEPAWCVRCHAPLAKRADATLPARGAAAEETGVTCAACHAGKNGVLASRESPKSPHAIEVDASLIDGSLCAQCHQFGFSVRDAHGKLARLSAETAQQNTFEEWQAWSKASGDVRSCTACHMKDHSFGGVRRIDALKAAIAVREVDGALELTTRNLGHPFPTGDIMRWLTLELSTEPLFEQPVVAAKWGRSLGAKRWADGESYLGVVSENRLPDSASGPLRVELPSGTQWAAWRLVVHLVSLNQEEKGLLPPQASRVIVNAGLLNPNGRTP